MFLCVSSGFSQTVCFRIDSIKVYYTDWNTTYPLELEEDDLRFLKDGKKKIKVIKDSSVIQEFCKLQLYDSKKLIDYDYKDIRIVIDLYIHGSPTTISINKSKEYFYFKKCFIRNEELLNWIKLNVTN